MIDFRYHLVSIIAVFMALAVGIVLGSGPLKDPIDDTVSAQLGDQVDQLRQDKDDLRAEVDTREREVQYNAAVVEALSTTALQDRLLGRVVSVVRTPGVDDQLVEGVTTTLNAAGAILPGTVTLTDAWTDPEQQEALAAAVDELAPALEVPVGATVPQRAGRALARSVFTQVGDQTGLADPASAAVLTGLADQGFLSIEGDPAIRGELGLLLVPPAPDTPDEASDARAVIMLDLAAALGEIGPATVVAGPPAATGAGGLLEVLRGNDEVSAVVSSVDTADTVPGQVTVVLALVADDGGESGSYGYGPGVDSAVPPVADGAQEP